MTDPAAIARGLSDAQREAIMAHAGWWQRGPALPDVLSETSGYLAEMGWIETRRLNDLGLAVREILNAASGGSGADG